MLQTTYLKILSGQARFDGRSGFKTWLFAVIRRTAAEQFRRRLLRMVGLEFERVTSSDVRADLEIERSEIAAQLLRALARLARRQREVLELVFYHDMTIEEAAVTMGVRLGTARVHYQRGKRRLLQELQR